MFRNLLINFLLSFRRRSINLRFRHRMGHLRGCCHLTCSKCRMEWLVNRYSRCNNIKRRTSYPITFNSECRHSLNPMSRDPCFNSLQFLRIPIKSQYPLPHPCENLPWNRRRNRNPVNRPSVNPSQEKFRTSRKSETSIPMVDGIYTN